MDQPNEESSAASRYAELSTDRDVFLRRAEKASKYTIPALVPPNGSTGSTDLYQPYQSLGARGVNHLAGKLLLGLFPPQAAFFRLQLDEKIRTKLEQQPAAAEGDPEPIVLYEQGLAKMEQSILREFGYKGYRTQLHEGIKHLIVAGNVLLHLPDVGARVFPLCQYVAHRDPEGRVLEIVVKEMVAPIVLPAEIRDEVKKAAGVDKTVPLYTHVKREADAYTVYQEVKGLTVPDSTGSYPLDKCPWLPLRWTRIDGESYGRGLCEEYMGDLTSLEGLAKAILEASAAMAKILILVKPHGMTRASDVAKAPNLAVREGDVEDVGVVQMEKYPDLRITAETAKAIEERLSYAFLLNSAVRRDAERVTAEEIRYVATELETSLGGNYSVFAEELQLPIVAILMAQMEKEGKIIPLPDKAVHPTIVTGVDALGRTQEITRIQTALSAIAPWVPPEVLVEYLKTNNLITTAFTAAGVTAKDLIRTDAEVAQVRQQQQMQALAEKAAGPAVKAIGDQKLEQQRQQAAPQETAAPTQ